MEKLTDLTCEACQTSALSVSAEEMQLLSEKIPQWEIINIDGINQLKRIFTFKNFKLALDFSNKVAELAEKEFHHPSILTEWGKVTVTWWSHSIKGLHKNDFIMAAKTNELI